MLSATQQHIFQSKLFIERNLGELLTGECIAEKSFLSYFHFQHQFKACTGESLWQYVKRLRLEKAAFLLAYTSLPVGDIAYQTGFEATAALSKAFRQWYGLSPHKYRQHQLTLSPNSPAPKYNWNEVKEVRRMEERILSCRAEGMKQFPAGYFQWMGIVEPMGEKDIALIGKSPDQPHITSFSKLRWDSAIPEKSLPKALKQELLQNPLLFEDTLPGGRYLVVPFTGFGRPFAQHLPFILSYLHQQGIQWRSSGNAFQVMRQHAADSQCLTDLYIPIV